MTVRLLFAKAAHRRVAAARHIHRPFRGRQPNGRARQAPNRLAVCFVELASPTPGKHMSSFATYLIGFIILIVGLAFAAYLLNVPTTWIGVGAIVLIGIGVLTATTR